MTKKPTKKSAIYKIDLFCSDFEDFLSKGAAIPILGTIPALLKVACGAVQFSCALISLTLTTAGFGYVTSTGRDIMFHSLRHILHGVVNILAGIIQAIPIIGSIIWGAQFLRSVSGSSDTMLYKNKQQHKFFGYEIIRDNTWKFYNCIDSIPVNSNEIPKEAYTNDCMIAAI